MQQLVNGQTIKADNYNYIVERHGRAVRLSGGTDTERKQVAMCCIRELEFMASKKRGRNKIGNVSITL